MENTVNRQRSRSASLFKNRESTERQKLDGASPSQIDNVEENGSPEAGSVKSMRPQMRDDDPRARAAQRAKELRDHHGDMVDGTDDFYIDIGSIPDGWTYEWKRHSTFNVEDPAYQIQLARAGWRAVPASRHPELMPYGTSHETILRKGMILMEIPTEIVEERRSQEKRLARDQVRQKEAQLAGTPDGTMTRDHAQARPKISKSYEAMPIPEK